MLLAYIDPNSTALILQLAISVAVGFYVFLMKGFGWINNFLRRDWTKGAFAWLIAASLANLALLRVWTELFGYSKWDTFEMKVLPSPSLYGAALIDLAVITLVGWGILIFTSRSGPVGRLTSILFLLLCLVPLNSARDVLGAEHFPLLRFAAVRTFGPKTVVAVGCILLVITVAAVVLFTDKLRRLVCLCLLLSFPFVPVNIGRALWDMTHQGTLLEVEHGSLAVQSRKTVQAPRVVWLIFDEMDQRITFEDRPNGLTMPEFDQFRASSLYADAVSEGGGDTIYAIPSMMTGRKVVKVRELGADQLGVTFEDGGNEVDFASVSNVFSRAQQLGVSSGMVGWQIPWCRIFRRQLTRCWWCEGVRPDNSVRISLLGASLDEVRSLFETNNFSIFGQSLCSRQHIDNYYALTREAEALATDNSIDLAVLHLHGAHPPHVYDRTTREFSLANSPIRGYVDSLALCDETLGLLRRSMQHDGLWQRSTVVVTSDHHNRSSVAFDGKTDHRMIFMVKLAGQTTPLKFSEPLGATMLSDLVLELGRRKE